MKTKAILAVRILVFSFPLFFPTLGFSQFENAETIDKAQILVTYMLDFRQDSTNLDDKRSEEMLLFIGSNISLFMSYNQAFNDTVSAELLRARQMGIIDRQTLINQFSASRGPISRFRFRIYKFFAENRLMFRQFLLQNYYIYEEPLQFLNWQIIPGEEKVIQNYRVQKATTTFGGRNWVAWFAPEIPISDGPYKFNGLPGLIIKIGDTRGHYVFTLTSFEKLSSPRPIELIPGTSEVKTTRKNFLRAVENFRNNILIHARDAQFAPETQRIAAENMRRRNNPIELRAD